MNIRLTRWQTNQLCLINWDRALYASEYANPNPGHESSLIVFSEGNSVRVVETIAEIEMKLEDARLAERR